MRVVLAGIAIAGLVLLAPPAGRAADLRGEIEAIVKDYLASHPDELGEIVKGYMIKHPEVMNEIFAEALKSRPAAVASNSAAVGADANSNAAAAVANNAKLLFSSPHQVELGNSDGDVTLVEFFDYNCGFCKRALPDMLALIKGDPKLKIVLKELPILGPGSSEAARVAVAVRMQDVDGKKYFAFHQTLLGDPGPASKEKALAVAKYHGLDMARLEHDMASEEVDATLAESTKLADALGISGTPGYVVGKDVILGAVGVSRLQTRIETTRGQLAN
jgi:protein-disulfide isomerase